MIVVGHGVGGIVAASAVLECEPGRLPDDLVVLAPPLTDLSPRLRGPGQRVLRDLVAVDLTGDFWDSTYLMADPAGVIAAAAEVTPTSVIAAGGDGYLGAQQNELDALNLRGVPGLAVDVLEGADHDFSYAQHQEELARRIAFLAGVPA